MIFSIDGMLIESGVLFAIIEVCGIGYFVNIPLTVSCNLPAVGNQVKLYTYVVYRDDKRDMYGFLSKEERDLFKMIVEKVSGVGPKITLNLMSKLSLQILKEAISSKTPDVLAKCHGIGKKSAERIIMELSDKDIFKTIGSGICQCGNSLGQRTIIDDAISAMLSLGYKQSDAEKAVKKACSIVGPDASLEDIIKTSLS